MLVLSDKSKDIVKDRINLINRLTEARDHFRGTQYNKMIDDRTIDHPYKDYDALRNYLALTCFDILGQPSDWVDFGSWLQSTKKEEERKQVFQKYSHLQSEETKQLNIYEEYMRIYGVKNSFFRFIRQIITIENRRKLLQHIRVARLIHNPRQTENGWTPTVVESITVSDEMKEKFLFKARNYFTHKGISVGTAFSERFSNTLLQVLDSTLKKNEKAFHSVFRDESNAETHIYSVADWPHILIEVLEDTINSRK